jgi:hypothetical protein
VDVTGFEPATPCLQSNATIIRKPFRITNSTEKSALKRAPSMWLGVSGCDLLLVGSLQKSLQPSLAAYVMKLTREQSQKLLRERGIWITEACDRCSQLLGSVRWTRRGEVGEWCSDVCRDGVNTKAQKESSKKCRECGVPLDGKRADSRFCNHTHQMRFSRKPRAAQKHENSRHTPIGKQGLTEAQNDGSMNTLARISAAVVEAPIEKSQLSETSGRARSVREATAL